MNHKLTTAMILAAGFGTRLKPLTLKTPKALVKVNGVPMIEIVLRKLIDFGIKQVVVNAHHFADRMEKYFADNAFPLRIDLITEKEILGTGGGIKNASRFLKHSGSFLVHNVDVVSDIDLTSMYKYHRKRNAFVTLAVSHRESSRPLLMDDENYITGMKEGGNPKKYRDSQGEDAAVGFCGVHIVSSEIFSNISENGFFGIFDTYFRLAGEGKKIVGYDIGKIFWKDMGTSLNRNLTES